MAKKNSQELGFCAYNQSHSFGPTTTDHKMQKHKKEYFRNMENKHLQTEEKVAAVFYMILYTFVAEAEDLLP